MKNDIDVPKPVKSSVDWGGVILGIVLVLVVAITYIATSIDK